MAGSMLRTSSSAMRANLFARCALHVRTRYYSSAVSSKRAGVPFCELATTFAAIERVKQSRDASLRLLAAQFHDVLRRSQSQSSSSSELASALYITASQLAPPHEGVELRFGTRSFVPVIAQLLAPVADSSSDGDDTAARVAIPDVSKFPDFGTAMRSLIESGRIVIPDTSEHAGSESDNEAKDSPMTISFVHEELLRLAREEGSGAVIRKQQRAVQLLKQCRSADEMVFLVRMLAHQSLRIGMGEKSILAALAIASALPPTDSTGTTDTAVDPVADATAAPALKPWIDSVTRAYAQQPDYAALARLLVESQRECELTQRVQWLDACAAPTVGIPVLTMSAYPVSSVAAVLERTRKTASRSATCEYKYDGARVQIHLALCVDVSGQQQRAVARIFSRNMEDNTEKYGSLLNVLAHQLTPSSSLSPSSESRELILEGEVVAVDRTTQRFLPFQVLQTKTTTEFCLFVFDLLQLDGAKLLHRPLRERRTLLCEHVVEAPGYLEFVKSIDVEPRGATDESAAGDDGDAESQTVRAFLQEAVAAGCEGLMVKALDGESADYKAGVRSYSWMKLKQDYLTEHAPSTALSPSPSGDASAKRKSQASTDHGMFLPDTLDLVPVGAFHGKGRRAGVFGSFLMATYNAASGRFETIGKVGSGFSDAQLTEISQRLQPWDSNAASTITGSRDSAVPDLVVSGAIRSREPDVWLQPSEVWEIKATQLTASPSYTCASQADADDADAADIADIPAPPKAQPKGLALRFPRFVRLRSDKHPEHATDSAQVRELFRQQTASLNGE